MNGEDRFVQSKIIQLANRYITDSPEPKAVNVELNKMQYKSLKYAELLVSRIEDDLRDTILDRRVYFLGSSGINDITDHTETTEYLQATMEPAEDDDYVSYIVPVEAGHSAFDIVVSIEDNEFKLSIGMSIEATNYETTHLPL